MVVQLDVKIMNSVGALLHDGRVINQVFDRYQHAIDKHRMVGREPQVADRQSFAERTGARPHRPDALRPRMPAAINRAFANPRNRPSRTRCGERGMADAQFLDRDVAPIGRNAGAQGVAGIVVIRERYELA